MDHSRTERAAPRREVQQGEQYRGRVAVIHRDLEYCTLLQNVFEKSGCFVLPCALPADALGSMLQTSFGRFDILVMDRVTACEKGMDLMERLRGHRPDFPVMLWVVPEDRALAAVTVREVLGLTGQKFKSPEDEDLWEETESEFSH